MAAVSGHSFIIGPMGKLFKSLLLWNQSANLKQTWHGWFLGSILSKLCPVTTTSNPWADIVLTYIVKPYGIWIVKLRCIRYSDILKRAYLCQVSYTGSPEPLVFFLAFLFVSMVTQKTTRATFLQLRNHRATIFKCHICCVFIKWRKNVVTFYLSSKDYTCNHWWSNRSP